MAVLLSRIGSPLLCCYPLDCSVFSYEKQHKGRAASPHLHLCNNNQSWWWWGVQPEKKNPWSVLSSLEMSCSHLCPASLCPHVPSLRHFMLKASVGLIIREPEHWFIESLWITAPNVIWELHTHYCRGAGLLKEEMVVVQSIKMHTVWHQYFPHSVVNSRF